MKLLLLILSMFLLIGIVSGEYSVSGVSNMPELHTAINNESIIAFTDDVYIVYKPISISALSFSISSDTKIDTFAYLDFDSDLTTKSCDIRGFDSGTNPKFSTYIESGYINVNGNLSMDDMSIKYLGSEYYPNRYNHGIVSNGNVTITNSLFEYVKRVELDTTEKSIINDNIFIRADLLLSNTLNTVVSDTIFIDSKIHAANYDTRHINNIVSVDSCNFTNDAESSYGDGYYSGIIARWSIINISNSEFNDCHISVSDRPGTINNIKMDNGFITFNAASRSTVSDSTLLDSHIYIYRAGSYITITDNTMSDMKIGTKTYGPVAIDKLHVSGNTIEYLDVLKAHGSSYNAKFTDNKIGSLRIHGIDSVSKKLNVFEDNNITGDVFIENRDNEFSFNTVGGNITLSNYDNKLLSNTADIIYIENCNADTVIRDNVASKFNITNSPNIVVTDCTSKIYNLLNGSKSDIIYTSGQINVTTDVTITDVSLVNSTYTFNDSTYLSHSLLSFTVHTGALSGVNVTGLDGTYELYKDSILIDTAISKFDSCNFTVNMESGKYEIKEKESAEKPIVTPTATKTPKKSNSGGNSRSYDNPGYKPTVIPPIHPPQENNPQNVTDNMTGLEKILRGWADKGNNSSTSSSDGDETVQGRSMSQELIKMILNWFRFIRWE